MIKSEGQWYFVIYFSFRCGTKRILLEHKSTVGKGVGKCEMYKVGYTSWSLSYLGWSLS